MKNLIHETKEIIQTLKDGHFYAECSCCGDEILLKDAGLFYLDDFTPKAEELYHQKQIEIKDEWRESKIARKNIPKRSEGGAVASNFGKIVERFAPSLPGFRYDKNDCRSLFDPIDYIIFNGLDKRGRVDSIIFAEIKTNKGALNDHQKEIRSLVEQKKVYWDVYKMK